MSEVELWIEKTYQLYFVLERAIPFIQKIKTADGKIPKYHLWVTGDHQITNHKDP